MSEIDLSQKQVKTAMTEETGKLSLKDSENIRLALSKEQQKTISDMYSQLAKKTKEEADKLKNLDGVSPQLRSQYLKDLSKELKQGVKNIQEKLEEEIPKNMEKTAEGVVKDNANWLKKVDMPIKGAFQRVPTDIVASIVNGDVYDGDWSLSKALWGNSQSQMKSINAIIAEGVAQNKSSYEIAKDLEMYVDPKAKKPWDWGKVYPNSAKKIDYNAQRLARTLVSHAYQQSLVATTKSNPFVTGLIWRSAEIHGRTCQLCQDRDGKVYLKDELPLDHPNGLCTFIAEIPDSMMDISNRIADWAKGGEDPELDNFSSVLGGVGRAALPKGNKAIAEQIAYDYKSAIASYKNPRYKGYKDTEWKCFKNKGGEAEYNSRISEFGSWVESQLKGNKIATMTDGDGLRNLLSDGRFKSAFEVQRQSLGKRTEEYMRDRIQIEKSLFGVAENIDPKHRPTYGFVDNGNNVPKKYGSIKIIFKDEVSNRASFTVNDSLNSGVKPFLKGSTISAENIPVGTPYLDKTLKQFTSGLPYIESQIHDTVTLDEIDEIIITKTLSKDKSLVSLLEEKGIKWKVKES